MRRDPQGTRSTAIDVDPDPALRASLAYLLASCGDRVRLTAHEQLEGIGLGWPQHLLLAALARLGGLSQQTLASRTGVDRTTLAACVADLEYEGAIVRERDFADRRILRASLTDSGHALANEAGQAVARAERVALTPLRQRDRDRLRALLAKGVPQPPLPWWLRQG